MTLEERGRGQFRQWIVRVVLLLPALALYAWAGSGWDPKNALPWAWTKDGWIVPAAGLAWVWFFAAMLFWLLSEIAWLLFHPAAGSKRLKAWASAGIILGVGLLVRIVILATWTPIYPAGWRWPAVAGDMLVIGLLMLTLAGRGRSLWWAALYAFHPLVLLEVAGNGHWIAWVMAPIVFLVGISHRFRGVGKWPVARILGHAGVIGLMLSPVVQPWCAVMVVALLPLAWTRAGWVLSLTVLACYAAIPTQRLGYGNHVPEWLLMLEWIPVWVLEIHELGAEAIAAWRHSRAKTFPPAASPVP